MFLILAEDSSFKRPRNGWKAKRKTVARNILQLSPHCPCRACQEASMRRRVQGTPQRMGMPSRCPVHLALRSPGRRGVQ